MKDFEITKYDKLMLTGLIVKSITGVLGASLILAETRPYLTLGFLAVGAGANEVVSYFKTKHLRENQKDKNAN